MHFFTTHFFLRWELHRWSSSRQEDHQRYNHPPCPSRSPSHQFNSNSYRDTLPPCPLSHIQTPKSCTRNFLLENYLPFQQLTGTITLACNNCWKSSFL
jgi:hypothetical protein